jgi:undecaprenyl-diphosphatase
VNDYLAAVILGIVEGLTEFLPISSTAHIRFAQVILQQSATSSYWKMFAVVIQLGAVMSVIVYFKSRLWNLITSFPETANGNRRWWNHPLALVAASFMVTAIGCLFVDKTIGANLERLTVMGWALIVGGILMWGIDKHLSQRASTFDVQDASLGQALFIGFTQIFAAVFPGTSRSMATIAGGQVMGMSRSAALEFRFLLSIPVMFTAAGFKLLQFLVGRDALDREPMTMERWAVLGIGFIVSFLTAWAVIAWFMAWVKKHGFVPFAIYRLVAGTVVLACAYRWFGST